VIYIDYRRVDIGAAARIGLAAPPHEAARGAFGGVRIWARLPAARAPSVYISEISSTW